MTVAPVCVVCGAPTRSPFLMCQDDGETLNRWLREGPWLVRELSVTASRQARIGSGGRGPSGHAEIPLPVNLAAAAVLTRLIAALAGAYERHGGVAAALRVDRMRISPWAALTYQEVGRARLAAIAVIDRPPDTWYAGKCTTCQKDLYAQLDQIVIRCRCRAQYDVAERRADLLLRVRDYQGTASYLAGALSPLLGRPIQPGRLHNLHSRGRLTPVGTTDRGFPLFRIGDVLDLLERPESRRHEGATTRR